MPLLSRKDSDIIAHNILNEIRQDFCSLRDWLNNWILNIKDPIVLLSAVPYLTMYINGANEIFKRFNLHVNNIPMCKDLRLLTKIRSNCIKLYNYSEQSFCSIVKELNAWLKETDAKLQSFHNLSDVDNYEFFFYDNKIINTFHLINKQCDSDVGVYTSINDNLHKCIYEIITNIYEYDAILDNKAKDNYQFGNEVSFNNIVQSQTIKMAINEKSGIFIVFFDLISVLNYYIMFLKGSVMSKKTLFKIKYTILAEVVLSLKNLSIYEKKTYGYKTLYDNEMEIINQIDGAFIKNFLLNLCKHYYSENVDSGIIGFYRQNDFLARFFAYYTGKDFDTIDSEIDNAIYQIADILNGHIKKL